ncbi:MAG TPA: AI-2E family transporter [Thermomicrobiales bacterium]|nr:AI-2E family transporter [Thermomicrobiales bacterium]
MDPSAPVGETQSSPRTPHPMEVVRPTAAPTAAWWRGAAIAAIALALAAGALVLLWLLARPLTLLLIAIVIAQALTPIVALLEQWLPRGIAIVLVYLALVLMVGGIGWLVLPPLVAEGQTLVINAPELISRSREWLNGIDPESSNRVMAAVQSAIDRFADVLLSLPFTLFSSVIDVILIVFISLYWLIATPALSRFTLSLFPPEHQRRANDVMDAIGETMGGYVRATAINGVIIGVMTYIGLLVIGVEYTLILAVLAGLGEFLPVVGPILAAIPAIAIALLESPQQAVVVAVFFIALQQLESNLLVPFIMRQQADVPPLLSLLALLAGSALGGLLGALIAIPLAGAVRVLVIRVLAPAEREWAGADDPKVTDGRRATKVEG